MKMVFFNDIGYQEIFGESMPDKVESILEGLDTFKQILPRLCFINSILYNKQKEDKQLKILFQAFDDIDEFNMILIVSRLNKYINNNVLEVAIFNSNIILEFVNYEFLNSREVNLSENATNVGLNVFKAYVWFLKTYNKGVDDIVNRQDTPDKYKELFFQWAAWPSLLDQYEYKIEIGNIYKTNRIDLTFEHLLNSGYSTYCNQYLKFKGVNSKEELIGRIASAYNIKFNDNFTNYYIRLDAPDSFFDNLSINIQEYKDSTSKQKYYIGIREKPLYKVSESFYLIISWGFFENIFDISYLFDFYFNSGIADVFNDFLSFKNYVGKEILEKIYFQKTVKYIFNKRHANILFDDDDKISQPDAYVRDGNNIYLLEFKDAFMPSAVSASYNVDSIKRDIDKKFFENDKGSRKGVTQLSNATINIITGKWIDDVYLTNKSKSSLRIYPIIIYSHVMYGSPGINSYLSSLFEKEISNFSKTEKFNSYVSPLVMMSLDFLVESAIYFQKVPNSFKEIIHQYNTKINKRRKAFRKNSAIGFSKREKVNAEFSANISLQDECTGTIDYWYKINLVKKGLYEEAFFNLISKIGVDSL